MYSNRVAYRTAIAATAFGATLMLASPAAARDCILDTNGDKTATAGVDSTETGSLDSSETTLVCGKGAVTGGAFGGEEMTALGYAASTMEGLTDTSTTLFVPGSRGTAVGARARTRGTDTTAIGAGAVANNFAATAVGSAATAQRSAVAMGYAATASERAIAIGRSASAAATYAVALGTQARAQADRAIAMGYEAGAQGKQSIAIGSGTTATADASTALGGFASAQGIWSTAIGYTAYAPQYSSTAIGYRARAWATNSMALGASAQANHDRSTAIGIDSYTTAANQVTLGGDGSSVRIGDIAASTAAQVGPVQAVTVDANGTLGTTSVATTAALNEVSSRMSNALAVSEDQFAMLDSRVGLLESRLDGMERETRGGIAAAMALGGTMVVPDSNVSFSFNLATYRGEQGYSGSVVARVAPKVYVSGGFAGSSAKRSNGGRVGVAFGM